MPRTFHEPCGWKGSSPSSSHGVVRRSQPCTWQWHMAGGSRGHKCENQQTDHIAPSQLGHGGYCSSLPFFLQNFTPVLIIRRLSRSTGSRTEERTVISKRWWLKPCLSFSSGYSWADRKPMATAVQPEACTNTVLSSPSLNTLVPPIVGPLSTQGNCLLRLFTQDMASIPEPVCQRKGACVEMSLGAIQICIFICSFRVVTKPFLRYHCNQSWWEPRGGWKHMARIKSWQMCPVIHQNHMPKHPCCPPTVKRRIIPSSDYLKRACTFPVKKDHKSWTQREENCSLKSLSRGRVRCKNRSDPTIISTMHDNLRRF